MTRNMIVQATLVAIGLSVVDPSLPVAMAQEARRHVEPSGGFSIVPPEGWQVLAIPGLKYKVVAGPPTGAFAPNINVVDEAFDGPIDPYVQANLDVMSKAFKRFRKLHQEPFQTESGLKGTVVVVENEQGDKLLHQTFYLLDGGPTKFVVTCTALADSGERLDPTFEAALKTFRLEKK